MAKTIQEKLDERLNRIKELEQKREEITRELEILLGLRERERPDPKPEGFSQGRAVLEVIAEGGLSLSASEIAQAIRKKWGFPASTSSVRTSAKYIAKQNPEKLSYNKETKRFSVPNQGS